MLGRFDLEKILDRLFDSGSQPLQLIVIVQLLPALVRHIEDVRHLIQPG
jgi:hypothetical protein